MWLHVSEQMGRIISLSLTRLHQQRSSLSSPPLQLSCLKLCICMSVVVAASLPDFPNYRVGRGPERVCINC